MLLQLNPPIPVETPRGKAMAQVIIDYGVEHDLVWLCFQNDTGEAWCWNNKFIRAQNNITFSRNVSDASPKDK